MSEYGELVERLRDAERLWDEVVQQTELHHLTTDAADAIEQQAATIAELRDLLSQTKDALNGSRTRLEAAEADARRYRWLRTRINWREVEERGINTVSRFRAWTHSDYRESRPASEHIDEYLDAAIAKGAP